MDTIKSSVSAGAGLAVLFVPSGKNRKFTIEGSTSKWDYIGEALADLPEGEAVDIQVMLGMKQVVYPNYNTLLMKQSADDQGEPITSFNEAFGEIIDIDFDLAGNMYLLYNYEGTYNIIFNKNCTRDQLNIDMETTPVVSISGMAWIIQFQIDRINNSIMYSYNDGNDNRAIKEISLITRLTTDIIPEGPNGIQSFSYNEYTGILSVIESPEFTQLVNYKKDGTKWVVVSSSNPNDESFYISSSTILASYGRYLVAIEGSESPLDSGLMVFDAGTMKLLANSRPELFTLGSSVQLISKRSNRVTFLFNTENVGSFYDINGKSFSVSNSF
jgi:hypothetical protein